MSTEEKNKALVCRFLEAQSKGDLEALDELLASDFVYHGLLPGQDPGREGFMQGVAEAHAVLSFIRTTIEYQGTDGEERTLRNLLLEDLYSFVEEGREQEDDITLLTLRRSVARG